ncbi:MAG: NAD-binding protein [Sulfurovum sp.]|nr:NAD-binding protein [Sulfurovum sp.]
MNDILLTIARKLHASRRYQGIKAFVRQMLTDEKNPYKKYFDLTIIFLIFTSIFILVYEVKRPVPAWMDFYDIYIVSVLFGIEYLARLWIHNDLSERILDAYQDAKYLEKPFSAYTPLKKGVIEKLYFMITPSAIIDLLAIFPTYRPLRLFRVLKLLRYAKSINQFVEVLSNKRFELLTLLLLLLFIVFTSGIAIYVLEEKINPHINSLFDAFYWALVTISTVGFGDISPVTVEGRSVSMVIIVSGIAMISFATSVIVSAFSEKLNEVKEHRTIEKINKSDAFLIICGYGQMTKMFLRKENLTDEEYIILENNKERVTAAQKEGYNIILEDASRTEVLKRFNTKHAKVTILCLIANDIENIYITLTAKAISRKIEVIARVNDPRMVKKFEHAGADHLLLPHDVVNNMIHIAITQPTMYKALHAVLTGKDIAQIYEIHVGLHEKLIGVSIEALDFQAYKLLFMGIHRRGEFYFNPPKDMVLEAHDVLLVIGRRISLEHFSQTFKVGV